MLLTHTARDIKEVDEIEKSKLKYASLVALLGFSLLMDNVLVIPGLNTLFGNYWVTYIFKNLLWAGCGILVLRMPGQRYWGMIRQQKTTVKLVILFSLFHLLFYVILGLFQSLGKSPYSREPAGILLNLIQLGFLLFGGEFSRAYLLNRFARRKPGLSILAITLIFTCFSLSLNKLTSINSGIAAMDYVSETVMPELMLNYAASSFAFMAGPLPGILYLGIIKSFAYISPYLPSLDWMTKVLFHTLLPLLTVTLIKTVLQNETRQKRVSRKEEGFFGWLVTCVLSVGIIWFSVGLFPIYPSVILTGSMEPGIKPGDVVLVEKLEMKTVQVGDIIQYKNGDGLYITHRITSLNEEDGTCTTKGDNNRSEDANPVAFSQVKGKVIGVLPKIGLPAIYLRGHAQDAEVNKQE